MIKLLYRLSLLSVLITFGSCKKKEPEKSKTDIIFIENPNKNDNNEVSVFEIKMELIIKEPTKLQLFYLEKGDQNYSSQKLITQQAKGSSDSQVLKFEMPEDIFPSGLRFDFGEKKTKDEIIFISMKIAYEDFELRILPDEFEAFFRPNIYATYAKESGLITCKAINGKYDPHFKSSPVFNKRLQLEER